MTAPSDVSANAETRKVLRDLLRELGAPTSLREARRWAERNAPAHATLWALLAQAERPQRLAFESLALAVIERGLYPSGAAIEAERYFRDRAQWIQLGTVDELALRHEAENNGRRAVLDGDQARWRRALLERLGWRKGRGDRWHPPGRTR